jgi:hypothetical protein
MLPTTALQYSLTSTLLHCSVSVFKIIVINDCGRSEGLLTMYIQLARIFKSNDKEYCVLSTLKTTMNIISQEKSSLNQFIIVYSHIKYGARGGAMFEALRYKPECRGIDSRWCDWNFSLT